jgi:hypothetical protein
VSLSTKAAPPQVNLQKLQARIAIGPEPQAMIHMAPDRHLHRDGRRRENAAARQP